MTGPDHYQEAERLARQADTWMDADTGWKAGLLQQERLQYRMADLAAALVHAKLADAAATALNDTEGGMPIPDHREWRRVAGVAQSTGGEG